MQIFSMIVFWPSEIRQGRIKELICLNLLASRISSFCALSRCSLYRFSLAACWWGSVVFAPNIPIGSRGNFGTMFADVGSRAASCLSSWEQRSFCPPHCAVAIRVARRGLRGGDYGYLFTNRSCAAKVD